MKDVKTISIQGSKGSFHDIVAQNIFGKDKEILERDSFLKVFLDVDGDAADVGIVAVENSIAGSIFQTYDLLQKYDLKIRAEYYLRIEHNLLAFPGQNIEDIWSHPMALMQCGDFLNDKNFKLVEKSDTAGSAKEISENKAKGVAAIASKLAASMYGLEILAENIETDKQNYTRFFVISKNEIFNENPEKTSISLELAHKEGSLADVVDIFRDNKMNMTKIESRPILGRPWEYRFYIDYQLNSNKKEGEEFLKILQKACVDLKVLGSYFTLK